MKIPKTIQVASNIYDIKFVPNLIRNEENRAKIVRHELSMEIDDNMHRSLVPVTFIHELVHLADMHFNCERLSEDEVLCLSEGLSQILKGMGVEFEQ